MRLIAQNSPVCQREVDIKSARAELPDPSTQYLIFQRAQSPAGREPLVYPGLSPLARVAPAGGLRRGFRDAPASFSNSSILRPDSKSTLTSLLCDSLTDVIWIDAFRMDAVFRRKKTTTGLEEPKGDRPHRGKIDHFSKKSRLRLKHQVRNASQDIKSQFLLTYPAEYPLTGKIVKNHLDRWFRAIRKAYGAQSFGHEWCLEFQTKRGAPHFHVFFTWPPSNELRRFLAKKWNAIVKGGKSHLWVHLRPKNFIKWNMGKGNYVMKYAQKMEQKDVPDCFEDVGRFWGYSRNMKPQSKTIEFDRLAFIAGQGWTEKQISLYFQRTLRGYHDRQLKAFGRESFLISESWSRVSVPNGAGVVRQLIRWVFANSPPSGDMKYRVPQGGAVPF